MSIITGLIDSYVKDISTPTGSVTGFIYKIRDYDDITGDFSITGIRAYGDNFEYPVFIESQDSGYAGYIYSSSQISRIRLDEPLYPLGLDEIDPLRITSESGDPSLSSSTNVGWMPQTRIDIPTGNGFVEYPFTLNSRMLTGQSYSIAGIWATNLRTTGYSDERLFSGVNNTMDMPGSSPSYQWIELDYFPQSTGYIEDSVSYRLNIEVVAKTGYTNTVAYYNSGTLGSFGADTGNYSFLFTGDYTGVGAVGLLTFNYQTQAGLSGIMTYNISLEKTKEQPTADLLSSFEIKVGDTLYTQDYVWHFGGYSEITDTISGQENDQISLLFPKSKHKEGYVELYLGAYYTVENIYPTQIDSGQFFFNISTGRNYLISSISTLEQSNTKIFCAATDTDVVNLISFTDGGPASYNKVFRKYQGPATYESNIIFNKNMVNAPAEITYPWEKTGIPEYAVYIEKDGFPVYEISNGEVLDGSWWYTTLESGITTNNISVVNTSTGDLYIAADIAIVAELDENGILIDGEGGFETGEGFRKDTLIQSGETGTLSVSWSLPPDGRTRDYKSMTLYIASHSGAFLDTREVEEFVFTNPAGVTYPNWRQSYF